MKIIVLTICLSLLHLESCSCGGVVYDGLRNMYNRCQNAGGIAKCLKKETLRVASKALARNSGINFTERNTNAGLTDQEIDNETTGSVGEVLAARKLKMDLEEARKKGDENGIAGDGDGDSDEDDEGGGGGGGSMMSLSMMGIKMILMQLALKAVGTVSAVSALIGGLSLIMSVLMTLQHFLSQPQTGVKMMTVHEDEIEEGMLDRLYTKYGSKYNYGRY